MLDMPKRLLNWLELDRVRWSWFGAVTFLVTIGGFWPFQVIAGSRN